jgi:long-chain-fatty-acid--[acyl-carrier-protein] ligase
MRENDENLKIVKFSPIVENRSYLYPRRSIGMRNLLTLIFLFFIRLSLWFRYRITIKGLENVNAQTLKKPGGILFLPNHPTVFIDPTLMGLALWRKFSVRPVVVEYMYYTPIVHYVMRLMNALPIPNFDATSNSLKKKRADQALEKVSQDLKRGDNFLIYPGGKVKHQAKEVINASGVHRILESTPEANVVLVRITGLWGSSFSRALTGQTPFMFATIWEGVKIVFKNLIFFTPRRNVTLEFVPAPSDFPYEASRTDLNHYLETFYNQSDNLTPATEDEPGESLYLVSYSIWKNDLPELNLRKKTDEVDLAKVPPAIQKQVKEKLAEMTHVPVAEIQPDQSLGSDLGLDSLDTAELLSFLDDQYEISGVPVGELSTVGKLMAIAAKQVAFGEQAEEWQANLSKWNRPIAKRQKLSLAFGETIPEVFFNQCAKMGHAVACGDERAGIVTYAQAKLRVALLAEYIRHLPGEYIGILLPSSVAAYLTILACQLAGKVPLMINWTMGPRHLEAIADLTKVQVVLSSWAFLDKLENVNLTGIEDLIVTLEDVRRGFTIKDKLRAFYRSKLNTAAMLKAFEAQYMSKQAVAVLLFTSGTENMPKGVPLTHANVLSNQRAAAEVVDIYNDDVLLGILPPFHAFGFTTTGILPLLGGTKVAYYADPTNGKGVAKSVEYWHATYICGAPTFLRSMFKNGTKKQLDTLHACISGAEKAPPELFEMVKKLDHCTFFEGYGITECSPILTANVTGDPTKGVGKPLPGIEIKIVDVENHQKFLETNQTGLILAKGPNIFPGYLNKGITSPFIFFGGQKWYSTGDLGHLDEEGNLIISGRLKRFVKVGGEMISLSALEGVLTQSVGKQAQEQSEGGPVLAICAKEEAGERSRLFLFANFATSVEEANRALKEGGFSNLVKIYKVYQVPEIPIMGTGKVYYRALEAQLSALNEKETSTQG